MDEFLHICVIMDEFEKDEIIESQLLENGFGYHNVELDNGIDTDYYGEEA